MPLFLFEIGEETTIIYSYAQTKCNQTLLQWIHSSVIASGRGINVDLKGTIIGKSVRKIATIGNCDVNRKIDGGRGI